MAISFDSLPNAPQANVIPAGAYIATIDCCHVLCVVPFPEVVHKSGYATSRPRARRSPRTTRSPRI